MSRFFSAAAATRSAIAGLYHEITKGQVVFTEAAGYTIYFPDLVDMRADSGFPYEWALYTSTDHTTGGIYLYVCGRKSTGGADPTVAANWKTYNAALAEGGFSAFSTKPSANPIFNYNSSTGGEGGQCETPCVNKIGSTYYMTFHNQNVPVSGLQATCLATSTDGLNFTAYKAHTGGTTAMILNPQHAAFGGGNHTGYFGWGPNPFSALSYSYIGYSLWRDTDYTRSMQWGSNDAINWTPLTTVDFDFSDVLPDSTWKITRTFNVRNVVTLADGRLVAVVNGGNVSSGPSAVQGGDRYEVEISNDGRRVLSRPRVVVSRGAAGSIDELSPGSPQRFHDYGGTKFGIGAYRANASTSKGLRLFTLNVRTSGVTPLSARSPSIDYDMEFGQDFRGASAFNSAIAVTGSGASASFGAAGVSLPSSNSNHRFLTTTGASGYVFDTSAYSMIELFVMGWTTPGTSGNAELRIADFVNTDAAIDNGISANAFASSVPPGESASVPYTMILKNRVSGGNAAGANVNTLFYFGPNTKLSGIGLRLYPQLNLAQLLGADRSVVCQWPTGGVSGSAFRCYIAWKGVGNQIIEQYRIRTKSV